ncbi:MAG: hypothetical protein DI624_04200 [Brevundimonas sp.]|uniref:hypothetical protein n=1 Tax=Brevundimonas sp. TaxID=1871086 RepID=UPI000DB39CEF|nr:hypothetical protein [Brevundimonas sp.]PZT99881.1 MAG: hypothetical protein DI624_04200 [Brevundimonas sp.]
MTAPSQTPEAAGLEVALSAVLARAICESEGKEWAALDNTREDVERWFRLGEITAASAQAAIDAEKAKVAELEALVASYRKTADLEAQGCDAAEARVDRLAEIASKLDAAIAWLDYPFIDNRTPEAELRQRIGFMMKDAEPNRAALQQETQP